MGAGTGWAGWARAHPGNILGEHCPPKLFQGWALKFPKFSTISKDFKFRVGIAHPEFSSLEIV